MHLFLLEVVVILKKSEATTTTSLEEQKQAFSQKSNILYFHYKTLYMQIIVADLTAQQPAWKIKHDRAGLNFFF